MDNKEFINLKDITVTLSRKFRIYDPPLARYICEKCEKDEAFDIEAYKIIICPFCGNTDNNIEFIGYKD